MSQRFHKHNNFLLPLFNRAFFGFFIILVLYNCCFATSFHLIPFLIIIGITLPIFTMTEGIILDNKQRRYKHYLQVYGFKLRKWHSYEDIRLLLIVKPVSMASILSYAPEFHSNPASSSKKSVDAITYAFCINIEKNGHRFYIKQHNNLEKLKKRAKPYQDFLKIPLEDCVPSHYK